MSVIAHFRQENGICIASDGVAYDDQGIIRGHVSKVLPIIELNCLIATTGFGGFGANLRDRLAISVRNFDELIDKTVEEMMGLQIALQALQNEIPVNATVLLAGWSDQRERFETYKIHTRPRKITNGVTGEMTVSEPWTVIPTTQFWCSNAIPEELFKEVCGDNIPPLDQLAQVVCLSRQMSGEISTDPQNDGTPYAAGGFLQYTWIDRKKIITWIAHRWPEDEIGKPLNPKLGVLAPPMPIQWPG